MTHINPNGTRLLIRMTPTDSKTEGGLLLPEGARTESNTGTVIAVGPEAGGEWLGRVVYFAFNPNTLLPLRMGDSTQALLKEEDVLAWREA